VYRLDLTNEVNLEKKQHAPEILKGIDSDHSNISLTFVLLDECFESERISVATAKSTILLVFRTGCVGDHYQSM
jgi:hypothetical protein